MEFHIKADIHVYNHGASKEVLEEINKKLAKLEKLMTISDNSKINEVSGTLNAGADALQDAVDENTPK